MEIRQWAVKVLDKDSPVPLPESLKAKLTEGTADLSAFHTAFEVLQLHQAITELLKPVPAKPEEKK